MVQRHTRRSTPAAADVGRCRDAREVREGAEAPLRGSNVRGEAGALLHDPRLTLELVTFAYIKQAGG